MKVTFTPKALALITAPLAFGLLGACGGGGGGGFSGGIADGGIRGTGSSVGPVSGFGSVFVNGIRFETDGNVESNDGITSESQLDKGMILRIDGEWRDDGQGTADRVEYDDTFRGVVSSRVQTFDPDNDSVVESVTFEIYGQTVRADQLTVFKGTTLAALNDGDFVRVSAWRLSDGTYRASYVGVIAEDLANVELEGEITRVDLGANEIEINDFLIRYSDDGVNTNILNGAGENELVLGLSVEIEGAFDNSGVEPFIQASSIEEDETRRYRRGSDDDIEFVGPVATAYNSGDRTFTINGLTVFVPNNDVFEDGLTTADLTPGLLIQVEGDFRNDGTVEAEEIELREGDAAVQGSLDANTINFSNETFRLGGVLVQVTPLTIITDDDDDNGNRIGLEDLNGNFELAVEGIERTRLDGQVFLEAVRIERDGDEADGELEMVGRLTEVRGTVFTVLGVELETLGAEFDDVNREDLSADDRPLLEIDYFENTPGNFIADEIELEN